MEGDRHGNFTPSNIRIISIGSSGSDENSVTCKMKRNERYACYRPKLFDRGLNKLPIRGSTYLGT